MGHECAWLAAVSTQAAPTYFARSCCTQPPADLICSYSLATHAMLSTHVLAIIRLRGLFEDKRNHAHIVPSVLLLCMHGHCLCCALCIADFCCHRCLHPGLRSGP